MRVVSSAASFEIRGVYYSNKSGSGPILRVCVCHGAWGEGMDFDSLCTGPYHSLMKHSTLISQKKKATVNSSTSPNHGNISSDPL